MLVFYIFSSKMYELYKNWIRNFVNYFRRMALQKRVTSKQIARLPLIFYSGEIVVVKDVSAAKLAVEALLAEKFLGFDIESKPAFRKGESYPPSLLQIAGQKRVYLFMLGKTGGIETLKPILENATIWKVGIAISYDIQNLFKLEKFAARGFYDLAELSRKLKVAHTGLRNLAAIFLRGRISKGSQLTDWSQETLTPQQISYAATDAWASREIFLQMAKYLD
ncbi:MAG: 3'-5' exonuclease domain-containing protein 2 [Puniceicoccales bacterium]|jgi:ribonuclease D|nr:3'-5' exonuclease domain-containing protein 2 [Puniceicoccales bacterium]